MERLKVGGKRRQKISMQWDSVIALRSNQISGVSCLLVRLRKDFEERDKHWETKSTAFQFVMFHFLNPMILLSPESF